MQTIKIAILGLGGVGGYYGGKLAKRYEDSAHAEIYFIARGEHLQAIKEYGIHIINENEDFFAKPKLATSDAAEIGPVDYLLFSALFHLTFICLSKSEVNKINFVVLGVPNYKSYVFTRKEE